jgi:hypothetical protein
MMPGSAREPYFARLRANRRHARPEA